MFPDAQNNTLAARLHHLTQAAHDEAVRRLCDELNATATLFPGTDLRLIYKVGSCQFSWGSAGWNFCRVHSTLRVAPAIEAKITDHIWNIQGLIG
jgi:hypothetical protein